MPLKNKLFRKAMSITQSAVESQDIVQETMIRIWDKRAEWKAIANMEVYALVLTKNLSLDRIKRHGYYSQSIDSGEAEQVLSDGLHPLEKMERGEQIALLWKIIGQLPENHQELVRLREIEELSYLEIAQTMNLTEAQVKITLFRVRQKMKDIYLKISKQNGY